MSDEMNEVRQPDGEGNTYDYSTNHAVDLRPIAIAAVILGGFLLFWGIGPEMIRKSQDKIPIGKGYVAAGSIVDCRPMNTWGSGASYRSYIRTPKDEVFAVYWRGGHEPPSFGLALGTIKYHECGVQDGNAVHCFDSFAFTGEGVKPLDQNGKPIEPKK